MDNSKSIISPPPLFYEIAALPTEQKNSASAVLDTLSARQIVELMNAEDAHIAAAVHAELDAIAIAVEQIAQSFRNGGRLLYVGAGTSGRLGILDASECPPTFGTAPELVVGCIAGGTPAVFAAVEGAEDSREQGAEVIVQHNVTSNDVVCGITASGRTPFVLGAMLQAKQQDAFTVFISTNNKQNIGTYGISPDVVICPQVGPEVVAGSTRLKSGTAQKMVLNMLTTATMVRWGKVYGNVMVDLQLSNQKLQQRAIKTVMDVTGVEYGVAQQALSDAEGHVKTALVMLLAGANVVQARQALQQAQGFVREAIRFLMV
jgi:N-acetylmuramic acid 6-phosphate etherase